MSDDLVDILVRRMETHPEDFHKYGALSEMRTDLEEWATAHGEGKLYIGDLDFFSDEQMLRLHEASKELRRNRFTKHVMDVVYGRKAEIDGQTKTLAGAALSKLSGQRYQQQMTQVKLEQAKLDMELQQKLTLNKYAEIKKGK
jgi:hypothetical protein